MHESIAIALLSQTGEAGRHLRDALLHVGTPIVYEAAASDLDRDALERSGARVVVVNLDSEVESHLDDVYALLDDDRYNVIFNEAQVSSQLSGWEQARWARHLVAKITGSENADPPRPEGAEAVPVREQPVLAAAAPVAEVLASDVQVELPQVEAAETIISVALQEPEAEEPAASLQDGGDFADIVSLLQEVEPEPAQEATRAEVPVAVDVDNLFATVPMPVLDLSDFDDALDEADAPAPAADPLATQAFEAIVLVEAEAVPEEPVSADGGLGFGDLDDFADEGAGAGDMPEISFEPESRGPAPVVVDVAEEAAAADLAAVDPGVVRLELLDLELADAPAQVDAIGAEEVAAVPAADVGSAFSWTLEDLDEGDSATQAAAPVAQPAEFGIETISAADFLAPGSQAEVPQTPLVELELVPIEEAMAPSVAASTHDNDGPGTWLDPDAVKQVVNNVWVMGASIGGPEAVREFLAELPKDCPALFLLAQHMGPEFVDIMAQQLARAIQLTVRTPTHGERVAHGDIVIVPTTHRLRVNKQGVVLLEALPGSDHGNRPSIDQVLNDVADAFGSKAGVIVFSGMAEDAAEGSRYLAGIGGRVYVQDPDTCVISSMVDGVIETGVVTFAGSPKALAGKVMGDLKMATKH